MVRKDQRDKPAEVLRLDKSIYGIPDAGQSFSMYMVGLHLKHCGLSEDDGDLASDLSLETKAERNLRQQRETIETWITSDPPQASEKDRRSLELYCQLTDEEFIYIQELQRVYDEARCYFVQWVLGKETKELVNSARISAAQQGKRFT